MTEIVTQNFDTAIRMAKTYLKAAPIVHSNYWQGVDISKMPEAGTHELLNYTLKVPMTWNLDALRDDIKPDLPWADDHFAERVSHVPMNPSPSEDWWPHAPADQKNDKFKTHVNAAGQPCFSHTYPERMWSGTERGQRFRYGDASDVASLLSQDPLTRQAFLPIWWPEDGGAPATERKPCTLGWQFIVRKDRHGDARLHCVYFIRSCDYARHFRNDIYMAVLLAEWMRVEAHILASASGRQSEELWRNMLPGDLVMHITSLHLFRNDYYKMFGHG